MSGHRSAYLMLAHEDLGAAGAFAAALCDAGAVVAVHIDARAPAAEVDAFRKATEGRAVTHLKRRRCEWGMFSLVEATLDGVETLLRSGGDFTHVTLVSGADLPLRPLAEFDGFLAENPDADVIEAVELSERRWVMDGLSNERFSLYHPFNWRKRQALFDGWVEVQRALKVRRRAPEKTPKALGSQWWSLTRKTLQAVLDDPQLTELKRYFRWVWIPDESFFQSLAFRMRSKRINLSPTLSRFDGRGTPHVFYDDHEALLALSDHFFVRKVHPRATKLREALLARAAAPAKSSAFEGRAPEEEFQRARRSWEEGREHLISPARFPRIKGERRFASAFPYAVIGGVGSETADQISKALTRSGDLICHGHLFRSGEVPLHGGAGIVAGCLPASPQARDFWPEQYVINLARGAAGGSVAFCLTVDDRKAIGAFIAADPGARVIWYRGAWALELFRRSRTLDAEGLAERARAAAAAERGMLAMFRKAGTALTIRSAADLIDEPEKAVAEMLATANARPSGRAMKAPSFAPPRWDRARPFLRGLQKSGCEVEAGLIDDRPEDIGDDL